MKNIQRIHNFYISDRGYVIRKDILTLTQKKKLIDDLTVAPKFNAFQNSVPKSFKIYLESKTKYYIPRFYGLKEFGPPEQNLLNNVGEDIQYTFKGELRNYQIPIVEKMMNQLTTIGGGILNLFTGQGKTVIAIKIMSLIKKKTLIVVHKEFLLNQWLERLHEFMPDIKIGFIRQKQIDVENFDVVIGMLQSISMKEYPPDTFKSFGFSIVDEAHHVSSEVFSKALPKISTKYVMGLSATLDRKDGLRFIFEWFLGSPLRIQNVKTDLGKVYVNYINFEDLDYQQQQTTMNGNTNLPKMINSLVESKKRFTLILDILRNCSKYNRKTLLLSERRNHLLKIAEICTENNLDNGLYFGGLKQSILKESEKKQIILGTYNMISEGFDLKELDTLIFATPKSDIVQSSGRILRQGKDRPTIPVIIDIVDDSEYYKKKFQKRKSYYKKCNFILDNSELSELFVNIKK